MRKFLLRLLAVPTILILFIAYIPVWVFTGRDILSAAIDWFDNKIKQL